LPKFQGTDFYQIDDLFSDEERLTRQTVREFVDAEVMPVIRDHYREGTFPAHLILKIGKLGLLGSNLQGYGCAGLNNVAYGLINQELERGDSGLRSFVSVQGSLVMYPIHQFGSEEQKQKWLPKLANGEAVGCFGLTEPDSGSNPDSMRTRVEKTKNGWLLNGSKMWITNGSLADVAQMWRSFGQKQRTPFEDFWSRKERRVLQQNLCMASFRFGLPTPRNCFSKIA